MGGCEPGQFRPCCGRRLRAFRAQAARELGGEGAAPLELRVGDDQRRAAPHEPRARARDGDGELLAVEQVSRDGDVDPLGQHGLLVEQVEDACAGSKTRAVGSSRVVGREDGGEGKDEGGGGGGGGRGGGGERGAGVSVSVRTGACSS